VVGVYVVAVEALVALVAAMVVVVVVAAVRGGVCGGGLAVAPRVRRGSRQWPLVIASGRQARSRCEWLRGKGVAGPIASAQTTLPYLTAGGPRSAPRPSRKI
jgi:hypothetical protein